MNFYTLVRDWLLDPLALLYFLLSFAVVLLWLRPYPSSSRLIVLFSWLLLMFVSSPSIVNRLVLGLENRFADEIACVEPAAIVVLAGGVGSKAQRSTEFELMSAASMARATAAWRLSMQYKQLPLYVSGGVLKNVAEADVMSNYLYALGVDPQRIIKESESKTTYENAVQIKGLLTEHGIYGSVLLVTSALHMPRAYASFSAVGVEACAYPAQRIGIVDAPWLALIPQTTALVKFDALLHEWVAQLFYKLSNKL